jgi:hypothetical protein
VLLYLSSMCCVSAVAHSCFLLNLFLMQYVPSVDDTVLGIVVDTKPDVSIHLHSEIFKLVFPPSDIYPELPWKLTKEAPGQIK